MIGILESIVLLACVVGGFALAASRGYRMPVGVCLALLIIGGFLSVAPTGFSFLLQMIGRPPSFSDGERMACWVSGAIMGFAGIVGSVFARRSVSGPPQ